MIVVLCHECLKANNHCKDQATSPTLVKCTSTVICIMDTRGHHRDSLNCTTSLRVSVLWIQPHMFILTNFYFVFFFCSVWRVVKVASFYLFTLSLYTPLSYLPGASVLPLHQWKVVNTSIRGQVMLCLFIFRSTQSKLYILYLFYI